MNKQGLHKFDANPRSYSDTPLLCNQGETAKVAHHFVVGVQASKQNHPAYVNEVHFGTSVVTRVDLIKCMP